MTTNQPTARRDELVLSEHTDAQGIIWQRMAVRTDYGAELIGRRLDNDRTPLMLNYRWTIPPDDMEKLTDWWYGGALKAP